MSPIFWKNLLRKFRDSFEDEIFLRNLHFLEKLVAKILAFALIFVVLFSVVDLLKILAESLVFNYNGKFFTENLLYILGLFLNILIILEVLENLTVYLRKERFLIELVVITSLTAVARKIIIFDPKTKDGSDLIALSVSLLALSISYWLLRYSNRSQDKK